MQPSSFLIMEAALVLGSWGIAAVCSPAVFVYAYLPGWALGLVLCSVQGHYEHARGTTSHDGWLYNLLFFNDGYHDEHHRHPGRHWKELGTMTAGSNRRRASRHGESSEALAKTGDAADTRAVTPEGRVSRWPPILRWLDSFSLDGLERIVLHVPLLQRVVVAVHARAVRRLLKDAGEIRSALIVGGGLFPRTALVLTQVLPGASLTIVDACESHLSTAARFVGPNVALRRSLFTGTAPANVDLVVVPLAFVGDRERLYSAPPARLTLVHDWLWHTQGTRSTIVSVFLLKRLNLLVNQRRADVPPSPTLRWTGATQARRHDLPISA
jgi:hypothetical protein